MNENVNAISLMLSVGCNLQCEYCLIHQSRYNNDFIKKMQQETIKALDDGSYLNNIIKVIAKMDGHPSSIKQIDLWGQEPTLQMEYLTAHIKDWLKVFPRLNQMFFSTNGVTYWEKIYDLITAIDQNIDHNMLIRFQWSYDGEYSTNNLRHGNSQIMENFKKLIKKLNQYHFEYVQVDAAVHGVLSFSLLHELDGNLEKIKKYFKDCNDVIKPISDLCINENVRVHPIIALGEETPYKCSTQEGYEWFDFINKLMLVQDLQENIFDTHINDVYFNTICNSFTTKMLEQYNSLDELIKDLCTKLNPNNPDLTLEEQLQAIEISESISSNMFCGTGNGEIKVLYDGTLINCQNSIYEKYMENINPDKTIENEIKRSWARAGIIFVNPLTDSKEQIEKYKYLFETGRKSTFWHTFLTTYSKMNLMSLCGQISPIYKRNTFLTLKHAFILCLINQCSYNNGILTGSFWVRDTGLIRRYANGMLMLEEMAGKLNKYIRENGETNYEK